MLKNLVLDCIFVKARVIRNKIKKERYNPFSLKFHVLLYKVNSPRPDIKSAGVPIRINKRFEILKYLKKPTFQYFYWMYEYKFGKVL